MEKNKSQNNNSKRELYHEEILKHAKIPNYNDKLEHVDATGYAVNQFCGDEVKVDLSINNGIITDICVDSLGCSINVASSSLIAGTINNVKPEKAVSLINIYRKLMQDTYVSTYDKNLLGSLTVMESVKKFPIRIKCALLATQAIDDAILQITA